MKQQSVHVNLLSTGLNVHVLRKTKVLQISKPESKFSSELEMAGTWNQPIPKLTRYEYQFVAIGQCVSITNYNSVSMLHLSTSLISIHLRYVQEYHTRRSDARQETKIHVRHTQQDMVWSRMMLSQVNKSNLYIHVNSSSSVVCQLITLTTIIHITKLSSILSTAFFR